jgi:hypothetical protein
MLCRFSKRLTQIDRSGCKTEEVSTNTIPSVRVPPSGHQVDGLPLAPRKDVPSASWLSPGRACIHKTRRVFSSSGDVGYANVLGNIENSDSYHIEASIWDSECSKWSDRTKVLCLLNFKKLEKLRGQKIKNIRRINLRSINRYSASILSTSQ